MYITELSTGSNGLIILVLLLGQPLHLKDGLQKNVEGYEYEQLVKQLIEYNN